MVHRWCPLYDFSGPPAYGIRGASQNLQLCVWGNMHCSDDNMILLQISYCSIRTVLFPLLVCQVNHVFVLSIFPDPA